jgi:hypothetical protein
MPALAAAHAVRIDDGRAGGDGPDSTTAYVLGLCITSRRSPRAATARLVEMSSTTFDAQFDVASEWPELYFESSGSTTSAQSLDALARAVDAVRDAVVHNDFERVRLLMRQGYEYSRGRRVVTARRARRPASAPGASRRPVPSGAAAR